MQEGPSRESGGVVAVSTREALTAELQALAQGKLYLNEDVLAAHFGVDADQLRRVLAPAALRLRKRLRVYRVARVAEVLAALQPQGAA